MRIKKAWIICVCIIWCVFEGIIFSSPRLITKEVCVDIYSNEWNENSQTHLYWDDGSGINYENRIVAEISGDRARIHIPVDVVDRTILYRLDPISEEKNISITSIRANGRKIPLDKLCGWITTLNQCTVEVQDQQEQSELVFFVSGNDPFVYFNEGFNECLKSSIGAMTFERWKWVGYGFLFAILLFFTPYIGNMVFRTCKSAVGTFDGNAKNSNLDLVRIFATWMVLSVHIGINVGFDFTIGAKGVQLFFALSGYLAFASLDRNPMVLDYYKKRAVRIIPAYWICLVIIYLKDLFVILRSTSAEIVFPGQCGPRFLRYFFFIQCFTPTDDWGLWNNHSALWTMSCFAAFYLVAPWLYRIMKKFYVGLGILLASLYIRPFLVSWIERAFSSYPGPACIDYFACMNPLVEMYCFLLGAVLFIAIKERKENIYLMLSLMLLIVTGMGGYSLEFIFVILIAVAIKAEPLFKNKRINKMISAISAGSFTLYLIHLPILQFEGLLWEKFGIENKFLHGIYTYCLCIGGAYLLYFMVIYKVEKWAKNKFLISK